MEYLTKKQMREENYLFVKEQYWDLILFFLKRPQTPHTKKCIEDLQNGWKEWEKEEFEEFKSKV